MFPSIQVFVPIDNVSQFLYIGDIQKPSPYFIFLKEEHEVNFRKYWNFVNDLTFYKPPEEINYWIKAIKEENKDIKIKRDMTAIIKTFLLFNFPEDYPEEDLFYFKMKYGG